MASVRREWSRPVLYTAGCSQLQQGTAEPRSQDGGTSRKAYLRKGGKHQTEEKAEGRPRLEEEEVLSGPRTAIPCSPWKGFMTQQGEARGRWRVERSHHRLTAAPSTAQSRERSLG